MAKATNSEKLDSLLTKSNKIFEVLNGYAEKLALLKTSVDETTHEQERGLEILSTALREVRLKLEDLRNQSGANYSELRGILHSVSSGEGADTISKREEHKQERWLIVWNTFKAPLGYISMVLFIYIAMKLGVADTSKEVNPQTGFPSYEMPKMPINYKEGVYDKGGKDSNRELFRFKNDLGIETEATWFRRTLPKINPFSVEGGVTWPAEPGGSTDLPEAPE